MTVQLLGAIRLRELGQLSTFSGIRSRSQTEMLAFLDAVVFAE
jgi:hypothetical protein